jgi:hypothetical protein
MKKKYSFESGLDQTLMYQGRAGGRDGGKGGGVLRWRMLLPWGGGGPSRPWRRVAAHGPTVICTPTTVLKQIAVSNGRVASLAHRVRLVCVARPARRSRVLTPQPQDEPAPAGAAPARPARENRAARSGSRRRTSCRRPPVGTTPPSPPPAHIPPTT